MADDYSQFPTVGGTAPAPSASITPEDYFSTVQKMYPNAVFTGGGRSPQRNAAVGGAPNSMHLSDQAMDFQVPGVSSSEVQAQLKAAGLPMTEFLSEGQVGNQGAHLHVGWALKGAVNTPPTSNDYSQFPAVQPQQDYLQFPAVQPNNTPQPNWLEKGIMGVANSPLIKGVSGTYMEGVTNGLFMQPVRAAMEGMGIGMDKLKAAYPGQTEDWYNTHLHNMYSNAVTQARVNAAQEAQSGQIQPDQPNGGRSLPNTLERGGQMAANFTSGILAAPQYLVAPGMGVGDTIAARIGTAGLINAGIGGASDAAAQGMDMMEGQKKKFDIAQNLANVATGFAVGGVLHGAVEAAPVVSDFVKSLFSDRGVDTLPPTVPTGVTSPMTTDHVQMNADAAAQYHQLLATGSVDDIKDFFKGRNGPQPSYTDVNNWVNHRDATTTSDPMQDTHLQPDFNYEAEYNKVAQRQAVSDHIDQLTSNWKNSPEFEVVHGPEDIQDPTIRQQALAQDPDGQALGFLGTDGKARIFSGRIDTPDLANAVTYHEALGHFGLQEQFGDKLDATLQTLVDRNVGQFGKKVADWQKANPDAYGGNKLRAAEEVLAEASQDGQVKPTWADAVSASVRQFGRKMGLKLSYSDSEVNQILAMAHDAVINGKGRDVAANGFRGANKFMFTGQKAKNFDPYDQTAMMAKDGNVRNEINDNFSHLITNPETGYARIRDSGRYTLGEVLHHPKLYDEYPQLRDLPVRSTSLHNYEGLYAPSERALGSSADGMMYIDKNPNEYSIHRTLLHEAQHAIQHIEGQIGTDTAQPEYASDSEYRNDPIEKEAFATENRLGMSPPERAANPAKFMRRDQYKEALNRDDDYAGALEETAKAYENHVSEPISHEETKRAALNLGFSPSQIKDLGDIDGLSVKVARIGGALNMAKARISDLNEKLDTPNWSMADKAKHIQAVADFNYIMDKYLGHGSEAGRTLNIIKSIGFTREVLGNINDLLREHGGDLSGLADDETFLKFARALKSQMTAGNNAATRITMRSVTKPYWEQYLTTLWHNSMLSSLATHFKSSLDMINGIGLDAQERLIAMPIGRIRSLFGGEAGRTPEEALAYSYGVLRSTANMEMYRATLHAAASGEGSVVLPDQTRIRTNTNSFGTIQNPRIPNKFGGQVFNKPIDLISAQDTFFRSHAVAGHLYDAAMQEAVNTLGPKSSFDDRRLMADSIAHNPTQTMIKDARAKADRTLLMNNNPLNKLIDKGRIYKPGMGFNERVGAFLLNTITPFIRVESNNLWSRFVMRSPLGILDKMTRQELMAGGKSADLAMARMAYGTVKMALFWGAAGGAGSVLMNHGPANPDKYKEFQAGGWSPDSVKEGGRYNESDGLNTSLIPWDMHNNTASMVASMRDAWEKGASQHQAGIGLKLALGSIMHDMVSQSWVHDLGPTIEASLDTDGTASQKAARVITNEVTNFYPNGLTQAAHLMDPDRRDLTATDALGNADITGTIKNTLESRVPGLSQNLPPKESVYGDPLQNGASLTGVNIPSPLGGQPLIAGNGTKGTTEPAEQELQRLAKLTPAAIITPVQRTIKIDDADGNTVPKKLTPAEFENYQRVAGRSIVYQVQQAMNDPSWRTMTDYDKVVAIRDIQTEVKKSAREALFGQPE